MSAVPNAGRERLARAALYLGGFLGPFGGGVIVVLVPELQRAFDASAAEITAGLTVYLLPFAALQLVSGTIGEDAAVAAVRGGAYDYVLKDNLTRLAVAVDSSGKVER